MAPVIKETFLGRAEVRDTFRVKGVGMIAGCSVQDGVMKRDADVRVLRDNVVIYTGKLISLRRFKEDVNEVRSGFECGAGISNFNDVKVGDILECFKMEKSSPLEMVGAPDRGRPAAAEARRSCSSFRLVRPRYISTERPCQSASSHWKFTSPMRGR